MKIKHFAGRLHVLPAAMAILLLTSFHPSPGNKALPANAPHQTYEESWVLAATQDNVECYYKVTDCDDEKRVFIRFNNQNSQAVTVKWTEAFETQYEKAAISMLPEKILTVEPGYTEDLNCESDLGITTTRVSEAIPAYPAEIKNVSFSGLQIINE